MNHTTSPSASNGSRYPSPITIAAITPTNPAAVQLHRFSLLLREDAHRLGERLAEALESDQLLDPVVVVVARGALGHPQASSGPRLHSTGPKVPREQVHADPVEPPRTLDALVPEPAPGRERLGERLGHELRRGLGIQRSPGEVGEHRFGVPLEQQAEQLRLA
jgi:hypothetical protein